MVNSCVLGKRKVLQLEDKRCYQHSRDVYISGFLESKITLVTRDCKTDKKSVVVDIVSSNGMQNPFPCLLGKNIHLRIFSQLQSYLPEDKYFHLGYDSPLKTSIYSENADIP